MPTPAKGPRLGGSPAHERMILANLATSLFEHGRITTTETKAKRLRPVAERLITFAKRGDLASRRRVLRVVRDKGVVHALFTEIGPQMAERAGGYTRITKIGPRKGDNAPMAVIELVTEPVSPKQAVVREAERATARGTSGRGTTAKASAAKGTSAKASAAPEPVQDAADLEPADDTAPDENAPVDVTAPVDETVPADDAATSAPEAPAPAAEAGDTTPPRRRPATGA